MLKIRILNNLLCFTITTILLSGCQLSALRESRRSLATSQMVAAPQVVTIPTTSVTSSSSNASVPGVKSVSRQVLKQVLGQAFSNIVEKDIEGIAQAKQLQEQPQDAKVAQALKAIEWVKEYGVPKVKALYPEFREKFGHEIAKPSTDVVIEITSNPQVKENLDEIVRRAARSAVVGVKEEIASSVKAFFAWPYTYPKKKIVALYKWAKLKMKKPQVPEVKPVQDIRIAPKVGDAPAVP